MAVALGTRTNYLDYRGEGLPAVFVVITGETGRPPTEGDEDSSGAEHVRPPASME